MRCHSIVLRTCMLGALALGCAGTSAPTTAPTGAPTTAPTGAPTTAPTGAPTTAGGTGAPTTAPTGAPTTAGGTVAQCKTWGDAALFALYAGKELMSGCSKRVSPCSRNATEATDAAACMASIKKVNSSASSACMAMVNDALPQYRDQMVDAAKCASTSVTVSCADATSAYGPERSAEVKAVDAACKASKLVTDGMKTGRRLQNRSPTPSPTPPPTPLNFVAIHAMLPCDAAGKASCAAAVDALVAKCSVTTNVRADVLAVNKALNMSLRVLKDQLNTACTEATSKINMAASSYSEATTAMADAAVTKGITDEAKVHGTALQAGITKVSGTVKTTYADVETKLKTFKIPTTATEAATSIDQLQAIIQPAAKAGIVAPLVHMAPSVAGATAFASKTVNAHAPSAAVLVDRSLNLATAVRTMWTGAEGQKNVDTAGNYIVSTAKTGTTTAIAIENMQNVVLPGGITGKNAFTCAQSFEKLASAYYGGICDENAYPAVERVCGECKVNVKNAELMDKKYFGAPTCAKYCAYTFKPCVSASYTGPDSKSCAGTSQASCTSRAKFSEGSSMVCQCGGTANMVASQAEGAITAPNKAQIDFLKLPANTACAKLISSLAYETVKDDTAGKAKFAAAYTQVDAAMATTPQAFSLATMANTMAVNVDTLIQADPALAVPINAAKVFAKDSFNCAEVDANKGNATFTTLYADKIASCEGVKSSMKTTISEAGTTISSNMAAAETWVAEASKPTPAPTIDEGWSALAIGLIVGGCVLFVLLVILVVCLCSRKKGGGKDMVGDSGGGGQEQAFEEEPTWKSQVDPGSGRTYWANPATGETTWHDPNAASTANPLAGGGVSADLPAGWVPREDPASGRTFYANTVTKETSWTVPTTAAVAVGAQAEGGLPEGWIARQDPSSKRTFYANTSTKETSWTRPQ